MSQTTEHSLLESLARDTQAPLEQILSLFERERDALARDATITNYISLLAVRRVRQQLMHPTHH